MSKQDNHIENAITGAIVGAGLGALFSGKNEREKVVLSAIAGAIIGASVSGVEKAKRVNRSVLIKENGDLVRLYPNGRKEFIRKLTSSHPVIAKKFKLK